MTILNPQQREIVRLAFDVTTIKRTIPDSKVNRIIQLLRGDNVLQEVRDKSIERYASYIEMSKEESGTTSTVVRHGKRTGVLEGTKRDEAASLAFTNGLYELTDVYLLPSIWTKHATLYSGQGERFDYGSPPLTRQMADVRERGDLDISQQTADLYACGTGSAVLHWSTVGDDLIADPYPISAFHWAHGPMVIEDGQKRPTNTDRMDEAFAVAIAKRGVGGGLFRWLTWFGESDLFPLGRMCTYTARDWHSIPGMTWGDVVKYEPHDEVLDKTRAGVWMSAAPEEELANPLVQYRKEPGSKGLPVPEYPLSIPKGHSAEGLAPTSNLDLLLIGIEYGVGASVVLGASQESALGKEVMTRQQAVAGAAQISETVYGRRAFLLPGQDLKQIGWSAGNAQQTMEVILKQMRLIADAHHCPGFLVAPEWSQWPSGEALRQAKNELDVYRAHRIKLNRAPQRRAWNVERATINMSEGKPLIGPDVKETWHPGVMPWPENPLERAQEIATLMDKTVYDMIDALQRVHRLDTAEEVVNFLKERKKLKDKLAGMEIEIGGSSTPKPAAPAGLAGQARAGMFLKNRGAPSGEIKTDGPGGDQGPGRDQGPAGKAGGPPATGAGQTGKGP